MENRITPFLTKLIQSIPFFRAKTELQPIDSNSRLAQMCKDIPPVVPGKVYSLEDLHKALDHLNDTPFQKAQK